MSKGSQLQSSKTARRFEIAVFIASCLFAIASLILIVATKQVTVLSVLAPFALPAWTFNLIND